MSLSEHLSAARAEGVAALQQAGDHVAEVGKLITAEMVNAAWNAGKDRRMTGLPTDFRAVLEAAFAQQAGEPVAWRVRSEGVATWTLFASEPLFDANWDRERYDVEPLYASPLPQQTALVEGQSSELDEINGRLA